jgi:predicted nuclease with RNAse H fold
VGGKRKGFDVALIDDRALLLLCSAVDRDGVIDVIERARPAVVALDSPRCCANAGESTRPCERQLARAICGIRWTPDESRVRANPYYAWIVEGLALYAALAGRDTDVIEVFPTASWSRWRGKRDGRTRAVWTGQALATLGLGGIPTRTNQDQRDAIAAALTALQYSLGLIETIGEIVVPAAPAAA